MESRFSKALEEASSKHGNKTSIFSKQDNQKTKVFSFTLQEEVGNKLKELAQSTPFTASKLLNEFIKHGLEQYIQEHWNR